MALLAFDTLTLLGIAAIVLGLSLLMMSSAMGRIQALMEERKSESGLTGSFVAILKFQNPISK